MKRIAFLIILTICSTTYANNRFETRDSFEAKLTDIETQISFLIYQNECILEKIERIKEVTDVYKDPEIGFDLRPLQE